MAKKFKVAKGSSGKSPSSGKGKRDALTGTDLAVAGSFVAAGVFCLVAFSTAKTPLIDSFIIWPVAVGAALGALATALVHRVKPFESFFFVMMVLIFSGAALATGLVLSLNRPLDRSPLKNNFVPVINKYEWGTGKNAEYFLEVSDFPLKRIEVEESVYSGCPKNGQILLQTRNGFFGFPYLERVQLISLDIPQNQPVQEVLPGLPDGAPPPNPGS